MNGRPISGIPLTKLERYRLRRKLTAALSRVAIIISEMKCERVTANAENYSAATTVLRLLDDLLMPKEKPETVIVPAKGKAAIEAAIKRRLTETVKRRRRRYRRGEFE